MVRSVLILANENQDIDQQRAEEQYRQQIEKQQAEERKKNRPLDGYSAEAFDADSVEELSVEVLKEGDGATVSSDSTIKANYFGWQADGTIFDSTKKVDSDAEPIEFSLAQVIESWKNGLMNSASVHVR